MDHEFSDNQRRALAIATFVAIAFGGYFLRGYFVLIAVAAVAAYLFTPLFKRCNRRFPAGVSATLTMLAVLGAVAVPVALLILLAVVQITNMVTSISGWAAGADLSTVGDKTLRAINDLLTRLPFLHVKVTNESLRHAMVSVGQKGGEWLLHLLQSSAGSIAGAVTSAIIFLYVFLALVINRNNVRTLIGQLNPLGEEVTDLYLGRMGSMVRGTVSGQFVIALCQGVAGAASIYVGGFHRGFFIFAILLTALSIIPLGGGIVAIPFGIGMMFFGHVIGGPFVVLWHLLVVTNIDNVLRPVLVPRDARLNSALMILAVFAGIAMFGFWGIVIGPVLMIVIVTTIEVYLAVHKGVKLEALEQDHEEPASHLESSGESTQRQVGAGE